MPFVRDIPPAEAAEALDASVNELTPEERGRLVAAELEVVDTPEGAVWRMVFTFEPGTPLHGLTPKNKGIEIRHRHGEVPRAAPGPFGIRRRHTPPAKQIPAATARAT